MERLVNVFERVFGGHIAQRGAGLDEVPEAVNGEILMLVRVCVQNQERFVLVLRRRLPHEQDVRVLIREE